MRFERSRATGREGRISSSWHREDREVLRDVACGRKIPRTINAVSLGLRYRVIELAVAQVRDRPTAGRESAAIFRRDDRWSGARVGKTGHRRHPEPDVLPGDVLM